MEKPTSIAAPKGKLGVLLPGMGAVATTFMAGVELVRKKKAQPVGSLTQMATIRLGKRTDGRSPRIKDFVKLAKLEDIVFGGWDIFPDSSYEAAAKAGVLDPHHLAMVKTFLSRIKPMPAAFDREYVKMLDGKHVKKGKNKYEIALQIKDDIAKFKKKNGCSRLVMLWCGSTEIFLTHDDVHSTPEKFEKAMKENHHAIAPSNLSVDIPALQALAQKHNVPVAGKDFKTGQTLIKTVLAPAFKARMLGLNGWFSTNILGNRDGEVLEDPGSFKTKEESKLGALEFILQPHLYPELYKTIHHKVRINYYPPRGDNKEGWDNIDIFGWLGYPMQIKVDFLCRDSILAAPIVLDLVLFLDLAQRAGMRGIQEWLSFYFKSPMTAPELYPEHDLFIQLMKLKNTLRWMVGEDLITHLGQEYYD
jgi:myo-inositol-1-phosphate synthase